MSATQASKSELKIETCRAEPGMPILVAITKSGRQSDYWAERISADFGIGVQFRKIWDGKTRDFAEEVYDVNIDTVGDHHSCECLGFLRHGHCRHVQAALQLLDAGRLAPAPRPEHVEEKPVNAEKSEQELLWNQLEKMEPSTARILRHCKRLNDGELARAVAVARSRAGKIEDLDDL